MNTCSNFCIRHSVTNINMFLDDVCIVSLQLQKPITNSHNIVCWGTRSRRGAFSGQAPVWTKMQKPCQGTRGTLEQGTEPTSVHIGSCNEMVTHPGAHPPLDNMGTLPMKDINLRYKRIQSQIFVEHAFANCQKSITIQQTMLVWHLTTTPLVGGGKKREHIYVARWSF